MGEYIPPDPRNIREFDFKYCPECGAYDGKHYEDADGNPCPAQN
jgi:hypothetical protein